MSASIAPAIATNQVVAVPDFRTRTVLGDTSNTAHNRTTTSNTNAPAPAPHEPQVFETPDMPDVLPPLPAPPDPPGTIFAAAVIAGALSPKPETPEEVFLRLGGAWSPPDSDLRLTDRTA
jgi:hypothetical protein